MSKKTKFAERLPGWMPNSVQAQWISALRQLRSKYSDDEISAFLRDYHQHPPRLGLSSFSKKIKSRNAKLPSEPSIIPASAFKDVADLADAVAAVRRVARHGIDEYLGPDAANLYASDQQRLKGKNKLGKLGPVRQAVEQSGARDFPSLLEWFKDEREMSALWDENKIHILPDAPETFDDADDPNGEMSYSNRAGNRKVISYKSLKEYHNDYLKLKKHR